MISVKAKLVSNTRAGRRERLWRQQCSYLLPYSFSWPGAQWPLWARLTMRRSLPRRSRKYVNCWWQRKPTASNLPCDGRFNPGQGTLSTIHFSSLDQWLPRLCRGYSLDPLSILPVPGEGRFIRAPPPSGRWPLGALDSSGSVCHLRCCSACCTGLRGAVRTNSGPSGRTTRLNSRYRRLEVCGTQPECVGDHRHRAKAHRRRRDHR